MLLPPFKYDQFRPAFIAYGVVLDAPSPPLASALGTNCLMSNIHLPCLTIPAMVWSDYIFGMT